jgi:hypothetical protein
MSKILRVQGSDYRIIVGTDNQAGTIVLDPKPVDDVNGNVLITQDLTVLGEITASQTVSALKFIGEIYGGTY